MFNLINMEMEKRTACFDNDLNIEAYHFEGIMQKFPNHFHEYYVVGLVAGGSRFMTCKNNEYTISKGDLVIFNPLDNHTCEQADGKALDWRCLNIGKDVMYRMTKEIIRKDSLPIFTAPVVCESEIFPILKDLHDMIMKEEKYSCKEETFYFLIEQLLTNYTVSITDTLAQASEKIQETCDYMESSYTELITLDDLSKISGLNKYTLIRNFTLQRGITPYQYLSNIRVNKAKKLLEAGVSPIEAAMQTGFTDQSHLTKFFKNFIGLTPKLYQCIFGTGIKKEQQQWTDKLKNA